VNLHSALRVAEVAPLNARIRLMMKVLLNPPFVPPVPEPAAADLNQRVIEGSFLLQYRRDRSTVSVIQVHDRLVPGTTTYSSVPGCRTHCPFAVPVQPRWAAHLINGIHASAASSETGYQVCEPARGSSKDTKVCCPAFRAPGCRCLPFPLGGTWGL